MAGTDIAWSSYLFLARLHSIVLASRFPDDAAAGISFRNGVRVLYSALIGQDAQTREIDYRRARVRLCRRHGKCEDASALSLG